MQDERAVESLRRRPLYRDLSALARYSLTSLLLGLVVATIAWGGWAMWIGYAVALGLAIVADELVGDLGSFDKPAMTPVLNGLLYLTLPLLVLGTYILIRQAVSGTPVVQLAGGVMAMGLMYGVAGFNVAHELVHRIGSRRDQTIGNWLLAMTFDTGFAVEHVYGHHRYVGTPGDPSTARRGESLWAFIPRSTVGQIASAWRIEKARLQRRGKPLISRHNRILQGLGRSIVVLGAAFAVGGGAGVVVLVLLALQGKFYLECVNYIEHYGLVRVTGTTIEARHSWSCQRVISNGVLYNLPLHADHHLFAGKPYWQLESQPASPEMPYGYMTMIALSYVPPLWRRTVDPLLAKWDEHLASDAERALLAQATGSRLSVA